MKFKEKDPNNMIYHHVIMSTTHKSEIERMQKRSEYAVQCCTLYSDSATAGSIIHNSLSSSCRLLFGNNTRSGHPRDIFYMVMSVGNVRFIWLLSFLTLAAAGYYGPPLPSTQVQGFHWVLASPRDSHITSCRRNSLAPTSPLETIPWGEDVLREVVAGLGLRVVNASHGLAGCCAPSLWCLPEGGGCYTQSLQENFVNMHLPTMATGNMNISSVHTCVPVQPPGVAPGELAYVEGKVSLNMAATQGESMVMSSDAIGMTMNGADCAAKDLCHTVCQTCTSSAHCPTGSICLGGNCFPFCSGLDDTSCPCSTACVQVNVRVTVTGYLPTHLCAPPGLSCQDYWPGGTSTSGNMQCHTPSVYSQIYRGGGGEEEEWVELTPNDQQRVSLRVDDRAGVFSSSLAPLLCSEDKDCFDMDRYTSDTCYQGVCNYTKTENVTSPEKDSQQTDDDAAAVAVAASYGSAFSHVRDRTTPYSYVWFLLSGQEAAQSSFEQELLLKGTESSVSAVDDFPVQYFDLDFSLDFFGNRVDEVGVNPNGIVSLPPFSHCWEMIGGVGCPLHRTSTNVISLWGRDWDPSRGGTSAGSESTVTTLQQRRDNTSSEVFNASSLGGVNADAFHVMYSNMHKFSSQPAADTSPNSFSLSLYEDGSMRVRYHLTSIVVESSDVFGLWGSRAASSSSSSPSPLLAYDSSSTRYHQETFNASEVVGEGRDVVFCSISTVCLALSVVLSACTVRVYSCGLFIFVGLNMLVVVTQHVDMLIVITLILILSRWDACLTPVPARGERRCFRCWGRRRHVLSLIHI